MADGLAATSQCAALLQESDRLVSSVLSIQPRISPAAGAVSDDDLVTKCAQDILTNLPAPLAREDASIARDPFAPLHTGLLISLCLHPTLPCQGVRCRQYS